MSYKGASLGLYCSSLTLVSVFSSHSHTRLSLPWPQLHSFPKVIFTQLSLVNWFNTGPTVYALHPLLFYFVPADRKQDYQTFPWRASHHPLRQSTTLFPESGLPKWDGGQTSDHDSLAFLEQQPFARIASYDIHIPIMKCFDYFCAITCTRKGIF